MIGGERITNLYKGFYRSQLFINGVNIVLMNPITEIDLRENITLLQQHGSTIIQLCWDVFKHCKFTCT